MKKTLGLLAVIFVVILPLQVFAEQITITKSGDSFNYFTVGNEDYKPSPVYEGGILLGDGTDNSCPVYDFILPPSYHSTSGNYINYIKVRLIGDDHTNYTLGNAKIIIGANNYETSIQATKAWIWQEDYDAFYMTSWNSESDEAILKVTLVVNDAWAKFDLDKIEVTYGYSNVSTGILDTWQNLHAAKKSFQDYSDNTVPTWDAVSTSINYLADGIKQCRSYANNLSNIGSSTMFNALKSANSAVDDLVEIEGTLSGSFEITPWITSYGIIEANKGLGNYYPSGIISNFDDVLPNLSTLAGNYFYYAFDGDVSADDYSNHMETYLSGLRSSSGGMPDLELGMNTAADIIKTIYINQQTDIAEVMFYSLAPMYTPSISDGGIVSITPSYLQEFSGYIDSLVLFSSAAVPVPPELEFPVNKTFARGTSITLHWNEIATANNYHLQVSLNSSFSSTVYDSDVGDTTSVEITGLPDNGLTKFYWRVKAYNSEGWGFYSDYFMFTNGCLKGDFSSNCEVGIEDLAIFVSRWLDIGCSIYDLCDGTDLARSGTIDLEDYVLFANQWGRIAPEPPSTPDVIGMVWIPITDPGVEGHESFIGCMSKYETTNNQYCQFLNAAKNDGLICIFDNVIYAVDDTSHKKPYFKTYPASSSSQIVYNGDIFSVRTRDDKSMENHPVVMVSWYGAMAFCDYYGYRLPTEWEWQAVADYDGSFNYGCGLTIDPSKANYHYDHTYVNPLDLSSFPYTNPVDYYLSQGYGVNDMAGNAWEWTATIYNSSSGIVYRRCRGGSWGYDNGLPVDYVGVMVPNAIEDHMGFRVCIGNERFVVPDVVNTSQALAETAITEAFFVVGTITLEFSDAIIVGNVISQSLQAGSKMPPGQTINLVVSAIPIPDVINDLQSSAESTITNAGLTIGTVGYMFSDTVISGNIMSQNPVADELRSLGSTVDLVVSLGKYTTDMVWVDIDDPGIPGYEGFTGQMSKYETTNAQYCEFLNSAKSDGLISVYNNTVYAISDTGHDEPYINTYPASSRSQVLYSNGVFSVRNRDGYSMRTHPAIVSSYGATAFCDYYGYRLPTEWEWKAVADYDGSYFYGCGITYDSNKANGSSLNPLNLSDYPYTTPVGFYPAYGYGMCDMAGNVWEWTSSSIDYRDYVHIEGGNYSGSCLVLGNWTTAPYRISSDGFRPCR